MELTNSEKIILKPEDWSTEEWKAFCKVAGTNLITELQLDYKI